MADNEIFCPVCSRKMVKRFSKKTGKSFYGCPAFFPQSARNPDGYEPGESPCKGYSSGYTKQSPIVKIPLPTFKGSPQQQAIWREMETGTSHLMVKALAGTGKTTTMVMGAGRLKGSVLAVAFGNKIARELTARMPDNVKTSTFHSLGWAAVRERYGKSLKPNEYKSLNIADKLLPQEMDENERNNAKFTAKKLVSLCKNRLAEPTEDNLNEICDRYGIEPNGEREIVFEIVPKILKISADSTTDFDFDDQIWIPIIKNLSIGTYDNVIVDETQDLNACRIELTFKAAGKNGRIIVVGDEKQAIFGFAGSDVEAMRTFTERLSA
jgi:superfamily I DNA/RNA helicase